MRRTPLQYAGLFLLPGLALTLFSLARGAAPSGVQELRVQKVGDVTYFHVRLEMPQDLLSDNDRFNRGFFAEPSPSLAPRLVAPDGSVRLVCQRFDRNQRNRFGDQPIPPVWGIIEARAIKDRPLAKDARREPRRPVPVEGLEFVGRTEARGAVKMKLLYPVEGRRLPVVGRLSRTPPPPVWKEKEVVLDFGKAKEVAVPAEAAERKEKKLEPLPPARLPGRPGQPPPGQPGIQGSQPPVRDDLEGLWAVAQVEQFLGLDNEVQEFGFYGFAATATARKYGVQGPNNISPRMGGRIGGRGMRGPGEFLDQELYETTTGAAAITESLQLRRMNPVGPRAEEKRTVPIAKVPGIDIAEHPWEKMIGDRKPAPEPFARLVPHDNYYLHFKSIARFLEFSELLDQWGTNLTRAYEVTSRDHRLKERYEQQLCLRSTVLGKTLGPLVIKGIGVTGSDAYVREGSDVAILFQVVKQEVFLAAVEPFLAEARTKWGDKLKQEKGDYNGVKVESFVTPLREVSLHRAALDDFVIYANSPVGLRRILDAYQGKAKRLADSLDFRYMRTVFRADDRDEDGFAFLSDAFIRKLVGPASKIKEKRRVEALVSLHMLTHGAMLTAWETGKAPVSQKNILNVAGLKLEELPMPEGNPAIWDPETLVARSDVYNTIHFATPLIELPLDDVTPTESDEYNRFRMEYLGLWRQYFDPIGMRVALKDGRVQLDTYILPLIQNSSYNQLRRVTGEKTVRLDPARISDKTLAQYVLRLTSDLSDREAWFGGGGARDGFHLLSLLAWALDPVGEWFLVRLDDGSAYEKLVKLEDRANQGDNVDVEEVAKQVWSLPIAVAADIRNPLVFAGTLTALRTSVKASLPGALTWEPLEKEYRGVSIVRIQATPAGREMLGPVVREGRGRKEAFLPALYYAMIDGGFYLTLNEEMLRRLIDEAVAKRDGKGTVEVASSLYLAPAAAEQTKGLLRRFLEHQTHEQARTALPIWYALYRAGIVAGDAKPEQALEAAYRYLGYVPVSPDGTGYRYDRAHDEVANERHGSFRKPTLQKTTAEGSPLNFLLDQLRTVRADLRFREDGIHTVLTIERGKGEK
jgi:hypothetical protein